MKRLVLAAAAALPAAAIPGAALAQGVTIKLTTPQQATCVVKTDVRGLEWDSVTEIYSANVSSMTGDGCSVGGGGDFAVTLSVPAQATIYIPIRVDWSTSTSSTICAYATATPALADHMYGWPAGSIACRDAACPGTHSVYVTAYAPGSYGLALVCTNSTGYSETSITVH